MKDINRIKIVLVEQKRTGKWLAEQLGKDPSTVSKWCSNKMQPSLEMLMQIAEKLDVSRNSIREVMHMLEINGLLECRQGSGNYVRCEPQEYMSTFINMVMSLSSISYTEVYHIRMGYETVALKLAISQATEEEIERMHELLVKMDEITNPVESAQLDIEFHNTLINASHNRMIILYTTMLKDLMHQFIADFRVKIMEDKMRS